MNPHKSIHCTIIQSLLIVPLLSVSIESSAQSQNRTSADIKIKNDEQLIRCPVYVAMVKIDVTDQHGEEVADLRHDDFLIYEDGDKQEIVYWKRNVGIARQTDQPMYEAGYYPTNSRFKGEWRKIRVVVQTKDKRKLNVEFTPSGYYAKPELRP